MSIADNVVGKMFENVAHIPGGRKLASKIGLDFAKAFILAVFSLTLQNAKHVPDASQDRVEVNRLLDAQTEPLFNLCPIGAIVGCVFMELGLNGLQFALTDLEARQSDTQFKSTDMRRVQRHADSE